MRTFLLIVVIATFTSCSQFSGSESCGLDDMVFLLDTNTVKVEGTGLKLPTGQDVNDFNSLIILNNQKKPARFPLVNTAHKVVLAKIVNSYDEDHGVANHFSDNWEIIAERSYYEVKGKSVDTLLVPKIENLDSLIYEFTYLVDSTQMTRLVSVENACKNK